MANFAVVQDGVVVNVLTAESYENLGALINCLVEYINDEPIRIGDKIDKDRIANAQKDIVAAKTKREAEAKATADRIETARVKAIEAENEKLRTLEAERLAAEETAKPKPVTGIFVKVEKN